MTDSTLHIWCVAAIGLAAGLVVGIVHFASLWWNTQLFANGEIAKAIVLQIARMMTVVVMLACLAQLGALTLLSGGLGFVAARMPLLSRFGGLR